MWRFMEKPNPTLCAQDPYRCIGINHMIAGQLLEKHIGILRYNKEEFRRAFNLASRWWIFQTRV
jgi:hypothetical protein